MMCAKSYENASRFVKFGHKILMFSVSGHGHGADIEMHSLPHALTGIFSHLGIAISGSRDSGSRDPGPFFNPEIPGLRETKSRDFGVRK